MFEAQLNEPQAEAVAHVEGPLLVFAGAGSGKTRVITYRVANLVACARVPPYRILAVTFTNKAAGEMRARLASLLGDDIAKDLWVGTFHATCARLLRQHGAAIGVARNFVIYDTADQKAVMTRVIREMGLDDKRYPPRAMLERVHKEKQEGRGPEEMRTEGYFDEKAQKLYAAYDAHLRGANALDFEDLILLTGRLLSRKDDPEASRIRRRFQHVLVDEFQDTNATQYLLLRELTREHENLCVVGDDDQSIYRWRGADVRNIRGFRRDFPGARVVKLEQNYRSTSRIVRAALGVIQPSRDREPKDLWTANAEGDLIELVATENEREEAAVVVAAVEEARREGIDLRQVAVFYRVHAQSRVLEEALRAGNLPYQIVGGTKFYERAEIKDAIAYLRVIVNPKSDVDLLRIINTPARGIGATTIDRLTTFSTLRSATVFEALDHIDQVDDLGSGPRRKLEAFRGLLLDLMAGAGQRTPSAFLRWMLEATGYERALAEDQSAEADSRLENLRELVGSVRDYEVEAEAAGEAASLEGFLERVTLSSDVDRMEDAARVTLMTVHGAKGLEFDTVLLTGMEEDMFPYRGMEGSSRDDVEEERRLAYVAITRARRRLIVTHAQARQIFGTTRWGRPSRFLSDLPSDAVTHKATRGAGWLAPRFVDREPGFQTRSGPFRHPQEAARAMPGARRGGAADEATGEPRWVDREYFDDSADESFEAPVRRGSRVRHAQFGVGEVLEVETAGEPRVVARFPGWGKKKILVRFLKPA